MRTADNLRICQRKSAACSASKLLQPSQTALSVLLTDVRCSVAVVIGIVEPVLTGKSRGQAMSRPQQTNDERTAQTRAKILDAAIALLFSGGYGAATTTNVAKEADVSRGAMTHHFPTRADLMMAVVEKVSSDASSYRTTHIVRAHKPGPDRYFAGADVNWEVERTAGAVALLEIMMATRSDDTLQQRFAPYLDHLGKLKRHVAVMVAKDLGVDDVDAVEDMLLVHFATLRGLSIRLMFTQQPEEIERARALCKHYEKMFVAELRNRQSK